MNQRPGIYYIEEQKSLMSDQIAWILRNVDPSKPLAEGNAIDLFIFLVLNGIKIGLRSDYSRNALTPSGPSSQAPTFFADFVGLSNELSDSRAF